MAACALTSSAARERFPFVLIDVVRLDCGVVRGGELVKSMVAPADARVSEIAVKPWASVP